MDYFQEHEDEQYGRINHNDDDEEEEEETRRSLDPDYAWEQIRNSQIFLEPPTKWIPSGTSSTDQDKIAAAEEYVRFVFISDTHANHRHLKHLPSGDVLVHAGDFTKTGETGSIEDLALYFRDHSLREQSDIRRTDKSSSLFRETICIAGNHDITLDRDYYQQNWHRFHRKRFDTNIAERAVRKHSIYLSDHGHDVVKHNDDDNDCDNDNDNDNDGIDRNRRDRFPLHVWGSAYTPNFFDWAFNEDRGSPIREIWDKIPSPPAASTNTPTDAKSCNNRGASTGSADEIGTNQDGDAPKGQPKHRPQQVDVLITHGPPLGRGDLVFLTESRTKTTRAGCYDLLRVVQDRVKPSVHVFGHIHEGYGVSFDGTTIYVNASSCSQDYEVVNLPIVVDVRTPRSIAGERPGRGPDDTPNVPRAWVVRPASIFRNGTTSICSVEQLIDWCVQNNHERVGEDLRSKIDVHAGNGSKREQMECLLFTTGRPEDVFELLADVLDYYHFIRGMRESRRRLASMILHLYALSFE